ncbi:unnamed protein product [Prunus armeniaca]
MEIAVQSLRIAHQHNLVGENYSQAMLQELEGLDASRIDTLNKLLAGKQAVSRAYNKRVKNKMVTYMGRPFHNQPDPWNGAYNLQDRDGEIHAAPINGKWLKKVYLTMWDSQAVQTEPGIEKGQH